MEASTKNVSNAIQNENQKIIDDYIEARKTESNLSINFRNLVARTINSLARHVNKNLKNVTRANVISFLNSLRKSETDDPTHKWIGTYNTYLIILITFFKWLYYPNMEAKQRPRPDILQNVKHLKRKEKSAYKPSDMWSQEDDLLFLKYCPSKRDRCFHMMSRDTSCRPSEILKLKIKDVVFKMADNRQYAEILVNGKTGTRSIPLINSIPWVKDMLDSHPQKNNPNAYLIYSERVFGRKISIFGLYSIYDRYKTRVYPSLLKDPLLDSEDKAKIQDLLKKPWNPYIRRHSALTEKSKILKEHVLRQHAGWTATSNMPEKYIHYFGNESNESILEAYGLIDKNKQEIDKLKPRQCPNCSEQNKIDSKFCSKCRMVLSYDSYTELVQEKQETFTEKYDKLFEKLDAKIDAIGRQMRASHVLPEKEIEEELQIRREQAKQGGKTVMNIL
ncbi:MAG: tyrosine-type recombinase/integrase, partial [Nitrososphaeraceae archaeon]|nr:tyrosine-type recombinase/integrase [Nitrososphaeraceae archaeon]